MAPSKKKGDPWRLPAASVQLATELLQSGEFMQTEIAVLSGISVRSVQIIARNFRRHGQAANVCHKRRGRINLLTDEVLGDLTNWLINRPDSVPTHLNEMKQYLLEKFGVEASLTTIHRSLTNVGVVQTKSVWRKRTGPIARGSTEEDSTVVVIEKDTTQPDGSVVDQFSVSNDSSTPLPQPNVSQANIFMTTANPDT